MKLYYNEYFKKLKVRAVKLARVISETSHFSWAIDRRNFYRKLSFIDIISGILVNLKDKPFQL